jgi:hypothetical protein
MEVKEFQRRRYHQKSWLIVLGSGDLYDLYEYTTEALNNLNKINKETWSRLLVVKRMCFRHQLPLELGIWSIFSPLLCDGLRFHKTAMFGCLRFGLD